MSAGVAQPGLLEEYGPPAIATVAGWHGLPDEGVPGFAVAEQAAADLPPGELGEGLCGSQAAPAIMERLCREPFRVKIAPLPDDTEPDTVDEAVLREFLNLRN